MGLFTRKPKTVLPAALLGDLPALGQDVLRSRVEGRWIDNDRFPYERVIAPLHEARIAGQINQLTQELYDAGRAGGGEAMLGAYWLLAEEDSDSKDGRFLELRDAALERFRSAGLSSGHLTGYEAQRWIALHGDLRESFDGIFDVRVPSKDELAAAQPLPTGESRMVALLAPLPGGNAFFVEHRRDGTYTAYSERPRSSDDRTRVRSEEDQLGVKSSLEDLLRAYGSMFGTPTHWYDPDLEPYFPSRRA